MVLFSSSHLLARVILSEAKDLRQSPFAVFAAQGDGARRFLRLSRERLLLVGLLWLDVRCIGRGGGSRRLTLQRRFDEQSVLEGDVQFDFFDCDFLLVGAALRVCLERVGLIPAADFLVVAEGGLEFALFAADEPLRPRARRALLG